MTASVTITLKCKLQNFGYYNCHDVELPRPKNVNQKTDFEHFVCV